MNGIDKARLDLIQVLAKKHKFGYIGRTTLMKYMYFLQTLREVPLGYHFSMYSYGPFDADVLSDLSSAEALNIVTTTPVSFSGGYGYEIRPGDRADDEKPDISQFLTKYINDIDWLFNEFGTLNSAELELASTIIYVDREFAEENKRHQKSEILTRVHEVKPHFSSVRIQESIDGLIKKELLTSVA